MLYRPPYTHTPAIIRRVAGIGEALGRLSAEWERGGDLRLRRANRIRSVHGSLAIEGNTLSEAQITAILEGKRVIAPPREIQEVRNALAAYDRLAEWRPEGETDLLAAHGVLMAGLLDEAGAWRRGGVGVMAGGDRVIHMAPQAHRVPGLMRDLLGWLAATDEHPLIASSVFHYEFEFIHPFADGNGRLGRLWQTLILSRWQRVFADLPVESLIHAYQAEYYQAIQDATAGTDSAPFIDFMLRMIHEALAAGTPQATPQVARLLGVLVGDLSRDELMAALSLRDRKSFRERYLAPALADGLIEMTQPATPNSPGQRYRLTEIGRRVRG